MILCVKVIVYEIYILLMFCIIDWSKTM